MARVATGVVAISLLYVNFTGVPRSDWKDYDVTSYTYYHFGWPTTFRVLTEESFQRHPIWGVEPSDPIRKTTFFGPLHLAVNLLWCVAILVGTWWAFSRIADVVRRKQFSLRLLLVLVTAGAVLLFLLIHYQQRSQEWPGPESWIGQPYLPLSGVYRWFGPRGSYDWLFHFNLLVRVPIVVGWLLSVCVFCSIATTAKMRRRTLRSNSVS